MAASRAYSGTGNHRHRYFSGEKQSPTPTNFTFEFTEFDVWNVTSSPELHKTLTRSQISNKPAPAPENRTEVNGTALSLPVDVPGNRKAGSDFDDDLYGAGDLIPPHEYLARGRIASFSVHEGFGRTLKGRDLSTVRNAVWKKIGFED